MIPSYVTPVLVTGTFSPIPGSIFDVNVISPDPLPVIGTFTFVPSITATTVSILVTTSVTVLLGTNLLRKGLVIQTVDPIFVRLDGSASTSLYSYEVPKKGVLEIENYCGPVTAIKASGSTAVLVTEKF